MLNLRVLILNGDKYKTCTLTKKELKSYYMTFNSLILIWFDKNKRNLPWRTHSNPYKIWLSEIILQQTRVAQGTEYYNQFCKTFPNIESLANATEQEVLRLWQGLGYYSRARNLHHSARYIVNELNGRFPNNYNDLLKLKGVGEYTAAAISSIAFKEAKAAIDGNAFRVFSRYFDIDLDISLHKTKKYFIELGNKLIDKHRPGDFNQAVMELGALVCLPKNPKCDSCPLNNSCAALMKNKIDQLPVKSKKVKVRHRNFNFLEITDGEHFLLNKRTQNDVWKNLFTFPLIETKTKKWEVESNSLDLTFKKSHQEIHILTHQKLNISFWKTETTSHQLKELSHQLKAEIFNLKQIEKLPLPKPIERYFSDII